LIFFNSVIRATYYQHLTGLEDWPKHPIYPFFDRSW